MAIYEDDFDGPAGSVNGRVHGDGVWSGALHLDGEGCLVTTVPSSVAAYLDFAASTPLLDYAVEAVFALPIDALGTFEIQPRFSDDNGGFNHGSLYFIISAESQLSIAAGGAQTYIEQPLAGRVNVKVRYEVMALSDTSRQVQISVDDVLAHTEVVDLWPWDSPQPLPWQPYTRVAMQTYSDGDPSRRPKLSRLVLDNEPSGPRKPFWTAYVRTHEIP